VTQAPPHLTVRIRYVRLSKHNKFRVHPHEALCNSKSEKGWADHMTQQLQRWSWQPFYQKPVVGGWEKKHLPIRETTSMSEFIERIVSPSRASNREPIRNWQRSKWSDRGSQIVVCYTICLNLLQSATMTNAQSLGNHWP